MIDWKPELAAEAYEEIIAEWRRNWPAMLRYAQARGFDHILRRPPWEPKRKLKPSMRATKGKNY